MHACFGIGDGEIAQGHTTRSYSCCAAVLAVMAVHIDRARQIMHHTRNLQATEGIDAVIAVRQVHIAQAMTVRLVHLRRGAIDR